jgi:hypothetical protein
MNVCVWWENENEMKEINEKFILFPPVFTHSRGFEGEGRQAKVSFSFCN